MKKLVITMLLLLLVVLPACKGNSGKAALPALLVGKDQVRLRSLEQESENLSYWVENGAKDRVFVRLSSFDGLAGVSEEAVKSLKELGERGEYERLRQAGYGQGTGSLYNSDSVVYVAHRLGIVKELYWVVPTFGSVTEEGMKGFKEFLKKRLPAQAKDIDDIELKDKVASGNINGVPVKIMSLEDLPAIDETAVLDIDLSFLAALYQNEKDTRLLQFVSGFFATMKAEGLKADMASIAASNLDGKTPAKFRFLLKYLSELFANPAIIDGKPPVLWSRRAEAMGVEQKNPATAIPLYKAILKDFPDDAASRYDLAEIYFGKGDMDGCRRELAEAVKLDRGYIAGYRDFAARLAASGKKDMADSFIRAAQTS